MRVRRLAAEVSAEVARDARRKSSGKRQARDVPLSISIDV
jgi:hypothetical protein